jgi:hypothetical protein
MRAKKLREKLIRRLTTGKSFAVWELPYDPDAPKSFLSAMRGQFTPEIMQETLLFVNPQTHQTFFAAGFPEEVFPHLQPMLNQIVGVIRNFNLAPELLIAMAVQGVHRMESTLTPAKVDRAYDGLTQAS